MRASLVEKAVNPIGGLVRIVWLVAMVLLIGSPVAAETGFLDRAITLHGETFRYQVYVPTDYTSSRTWPLIVSLHGNGDQGSDGMFQTNSSFARRIRDNRASFPAIVVFPQAKIGTRWLYPEMQELVIAELNRVIAKFRIDTTRIYLQGYSMGATGSYRLAFRWPEKFAALVVVAGRVEPGAAYSSAEIDIDRRTNLFVTAPDPFASLAPKIKNIPIWIFHGDADEQVPVAQSRQLVSALKKVGAQVRYTEYPGANHSNAPQKAYAESDLFGWLLSQHR
jgi:predicted peptidase